MFTYHYPKITTGYRWNFVKRCLYELGVEPACIGDVGEETFIQFDCEIDKLKLDNIVSNDPQNPHPDWDYVEIRDIEAVLEDYRRAAGVDVMVFYTESVKGSGNYDTIRLCTKGRLTHEDKTALLTAYIKLFKACSFDIK